MVNINIKISIIFVINHIFHITALADKERDKDANKRHTMSHPPDHIPELDSPRQGRSPLKKDKKEKVNFHSISQFKIIILFLLNKINFMIMFSQII